MIDFNQAQKLMESFVTEQQQDIDSDILEDGNDLIIVLEDIINKSYGWVFSHQPRKIIETGEIQCSILGNSPILILKEDGSMYDLETYQSIEFALQEYEGGEDALNRIR